MSGAQAMLETIAEATVVGALLGGLAPRRRIILLGVGREPLPVPSGFLVGGERGIVGSLTGSPCESEEALEFSVLTGVRPLIEPMPPGRAGDACRRMRSGAARFRVVLVPGGMFRVGGDP